MSSQFRYLNQLIFMILQLLPKKNYSKFDKLDKFNKFRPLKVNVIDFNKHKLNQHFQATREFTLENKNQSQVHIKTRIKTFYKQNRRKLKQKLASKMFPENEKQINNLFFIEVESRTNLHSKSRSNLKSRSKERAKTDDIRSSECYKQFLQGEDFIYNDKINTKNNPCLHIRRLQKKVCSFSQKQSQNHFRKSYSSKFRLTIRKNKNSFAEVKNQMPETIVAKAKKYQFMEMEDKLGPWQQISGKWGIKLKE